MPEVKRILALDISTHTGWALGMSDVMPRVSVEDLKGKDAKSQFVADGIGPFIRDICFSESTRPDMIIYEAVMGNFDSRDDREGDRKIDRNAASIDIPRYAVGAVRGVAACFGVDVIDVHPATWRKHFLGRANFGSKEATKLMTIARCHRLGYLPITSKNDNKADAAGIFDYAAAKFCGGSPAPFYPFDQGKMKHQGEPAQRG